MRHSEDGHRSDQNMWVQRIKDKIKYLNNFVSVHLLVYAWIINLPWYIVRNIKYVYLAFPEYLDMHQIMSDYLQIFKESKYIYFLYLEKPLCWDTEFVTLYIDSS
jgi:hypothetical protein